MDKMLVDHREGQLPREESKVNSVPNV